MIAWQRSGSGYEWDPVRFRGLVIRALRVDVRQNSAWLVPESGGSANEHPSLQYIRIDCLGKTLTHLYCKKSSVHVSLDKGHVRWPPLFLANQIRSLYSHLRPNKAGTSRLPKTTHIHFLHARTLCNRL